MKGLHYRRIILVIITLLFAGTSHAQFLWHRTFECIDWRSYYFLSELACSGPTCIACGTVDDGVRVVTSRIFLRSTDAGATWNLQDPGLPWYSFESLVIPMLQLQQIDSLSAVSAGDDGLFVRTTDGGVSWQRFAGPSTQRLSELHFSSPDSGIATVSSVSVSGTIFTTSNGGASWHTVSFPFDGSRLIGCHAFGGGRYAVLSGTAARLITTTDNWKSFEYSAPIVDSSEDPNWQSYIFTKCLFGGNDTILVIGSLLISGGGAAIIRSVDGGKHWEKPQVFQDPYSLDFASPITRDTIIAGAFGGGSEYWFLMSTDRGATWTRDTIALASGLIAADAGAVSWSSRGPIALVPESRGTKGTLQCIELGKPLVSNVVSEQPLGARGVVYPNPANEYVEVHAEVGVESVHLLDLLDREVAHSACDISGQARLDIRPLPSGVYIVVSETGGARSVIGRLIVEHQ